MRTFLSEKDVKAEVKKILNHHEWYWWMPPANGFGKSNVDFNALRGGVFMAIETKFGKNTATPMQQAFLHSVTAESGFGFIVTEHTVEAFRQWMQSFDSAAQQMMSGKTVAPENGATMLEAMRLLTEPYVMAAVKPRTRRTKGTDPDAVP